MPMDSPSKSRLVIYERTDHRWSWRLVQPDGVVVATGGEVGFGSASEASASAKRVIFGDYVDVEEDRRGL